MVTVAAFTACSPEKFDAPDQNGIPSISGVDIQLTVDQTVNQATYTVAGLQKATYPIWLLDGKTYSTLTQGAYSNSKAGTHTLELRIGNKNGFSQGTVFKEFTFDNTIIDFTPYINRITGEWRINYAEAGHMVSRVPMVATGGALLPTTRLTGVSMTTASPSPLIANIPIILEKVAQSM